MSRDLLFAPIMHLSSCHDGGNRQTCFATLLVGAKFTADVKKNIYETFI